LVALQRARCCFVTQGPIVWSGAQKLGALAVWRLQLGPTLQVARVPVLLLAGDAQPAADHPDRECLIDKMTLPSSQLFDGALNLLSVSLLTTTWCHPPQVSNSKTVSIFSPAAEAKSERGDAAISQFRVWMANGIRRCCTVTRRPEMIAVSPSVRLPVAVASAPCHQRSCTVTSAGDEGLSFGSDCGLSCGASQPCSSHHRSRNYLDEGSILLG